jgi:hypothetical protein
VTARAVCCSFLALLALAPAAGAADVPSARTL